MQEDKGNNKYKRYIELAFQYHIAAASLWVSIADSPYLFNPCMFLARHTIELLIKSLIYRDCEITPDKKVGKGKNKRSVDNAHDLLSLWNYYLEEKQPSLLPSSEESERIRKAISSISIKDMDSTKYRYPETKNPVSNLNLEPIKITKDALIAPDISKTGTILAISANNVGIIKSGKNSLKHGHDAFDLIEDLYQLTEQ